MNYCYNKSNTTRSGRRNHLVLDSSGAKIISSWWSGSGSTDVVDLLSIWCNLCISIARSEIFTHVHHTINYKINVPFLKVDYFSGPPQSEIF